MLVQVNAKMIMSMALNFNISDFLDCAAQMATINSRIIGVKTAKIRNNF